MATSAPFRLGKHYHRTGREIMWAIFLDIFRDRFTKMQRHALYLPSFIHRRHPSQAHSRLGMHTRTQDSPGGLGRRRRHPGQTG